MTILYIDDDDEDREVFGEALRMLNPKIVYQHSSKARESLTSLNDREHLPNYIFLDVLMPSMSGAEFLLEVKNNNRLKNIPIVLCSTYLTPKANIEFRALGVDDILIKPHSFEELVKSLAMILKIS